MLGKPLTLLLLLTVVSVEARETSVQDITKQTTSMSIDGSLFSALVGIGTNTHMPIGVVLDMANPRHLCQEYRQITVQDKPVSQVLNEILAQSSYEWLLSGGVTLIRPAHMSDQASRVLNITFETFGGVQTTMQGLGVILSGWVYGRLHPESGGFASDVLSSSTDEEFPQFKVRSASVEQILNQIVSLGGKGVWVFRLRPDFDKSRDIELHTYSYKDDATALHAICSSIADQ